MDIPILETTNDLPWYIGSLVIMGFMFVGFIVRHMTGKMFGDRQPCSLHGDFENKVTMNNDMLIEINTGIKSVKEEQRSAKKDREKLWERFDDMVESLGYVKGLVTNIVVKETPSIHKKKLLLVEDDTTICEAYRRLFATYGLTTTTVDNIKDAKKELEVGSYTHALIDYNLKNGERGYPLWKYIHNVHPGVKPFVYTGGSAYDVPEFAEITEKREYLHKPGDVDPDKFVKAVLEG